MPDALGDWAPAEFERHGHAVLRMLREHFESIRDIPVACPIAPADLLALLDSPIPDRGEDFSAILEDTREKVVPWLTHWNHPSFHAYFSISASMPGVLAETAIAALNVNAMVWQSSPAASALEVVVLRWLAELAGCPPEADGVLVNGASLATLYALAAGRDATGLDVRAHGLACAPPMRIYTSDQAHSSVDKAAITLGIGLDNVTRVPSDEHYRLRTDLLAEAIEADLAAGIRPVAVVATVGTTSVGAVDPLPEIAEVCQEHGVWLHADAAYGGFWQSVPGVEPVDLALADSVVVNPHKTLFTPLEVSALYCRRPGALSETFRLVPEYLRTPQEPGVVDYMDRTPQLGRGFRALKLWWVIRSFGREGITARLAHAIELAAWLRREVDAHPDWSCPVRSDYPLVCLRYDPRALRATGTERAGRLDELNAAILADLNASGTAFASHARIRDGYVIRLSIGNIRTTAADVERLWTTLRQIADKHVGEPA